MIFLSPGECGVVHLHENQRMIGGSRVEDHISRCALQDVYELQQNSQQPAALCKQLTSEVTTNIVQTNSRF